MCNELNNDPPKGNDVVWPFVVLYFIMLLSIPLTLSNDDPIALAISPAVILGLLLLPCIVAYFAFARFKKHRLFAFGQPSLLRDLGWHIFAFTGIVFLSHLFFRAVICVAIIYFHAPIFDAACKLPSERDVSLLVWDDMARGAFKLFAKYLDLAAPACTPNPDSRTRSAIELSIKLFTSLVLVWFALSLAKAWYEQIRGR